jgi:hypothetical protein
VWFANDAEAVFIISGIFLKSNMAATPKNVANQSKINEKYSLYLFEYEIMFLKVQTYLKCLKVSKIRPNLRQIEMYIFRSIFSCVFDIKINVSI